MASPSNLSLRGIRLTNAVHSEVAPCLPLPSLPVFCGAIDQKIRLFDEPRSLNRSDVIAQASKISDLLGETDVSYLCLRDDRSINPHTIKEPLHLYEKVLNCNSEAFEYITPGPVKDHPMHNNTACEKPFESGIYVSIKAQRDTGRSYDLQFEHTPINNSFTPRKSRVKKKGSDGISSSIEPNSSELQDAAITAFCEFLENFCSNAEVPSDDQEEAEWLSLPLTDLRKLVNEIMTIYSKKILCLVPVDSLVRLLRVLDHQIFGAQGLSISECQHSDSDFVSSIFCALESIHASVAVMSHNDMPKKIYKEEAIERILEFSRHQIMDIMLASDPSYRSLHKPQENYDLDGDDDDDDDADADFGSSSKKRRTSRVAKVRKTGSKKISVAVNAITQKLCTILGFLKDVLLIERLSDSCILQLMKTCFTTFLVDNIQLLQLKAIGLISAIFSSYKDHRSYVVDETLHLFWKLPPSKRALRAYHLPDEEQKQIQMVTALLIQLVQGCANFPESFRKAGNLSLDVSIDGSYISKSYGAVREACCLFWSHVLQRFKSVKSQDASELKVTMENLVMDLLETLNLPEYPASAPILEVLCVLLLQNAGPKSKDVAARTMAIDILGTIAARLKQNSVICNGDNFWMTEELDGNDTLDCKYPKDACSVCLSGHVENLFVCQGCQRLFHAECMGVTEHEVPIRGWYCQLCQCKRQLLVLKSYCKTQYNDREQKSSLSGKKDSEASDLITKVEIVQQMLLNYLQDAGSTDDMHLFARWFYLCLWYKDDPDGEDKFIYCLSKLKSKYIVRDSGTISSLLTRSSVKKITLALGQNNSFSRGFDNILGLLLTSLRENSPIIRAKALRGVSIIVEVDPAVLFEKRVQLAVEGRFCDSAISVREAALELVGRHIASHPDVGLKYFEKVAERIKDTGVSVRKRAIKIIRDMCTSNPNFSKFTTACVEIISRVSDDEASIQDLVCKTIYEFWFEEPLRSQTQFFGDGSCIPLEVAKKTDQIVDMLKMMPSHHLLITIIKRNLALDFFPQSAKAVGINPISLASVRKRCELMCKFLLERILQVQEMNSEEVELCTQSYVLVLHSFCVVDPTLCVPVSDPSQFVVTLQPYLNLKSQADNRVVANLLESILFVIGSVIPLLRRLPQAVSEELEQDLKHMILRHSFLTVVHACIKCLCSLSKLAGKGSSVVEYLIQIFYRHLDSLRLDNQQLVGRSLFCLGLLIRYGNSLLSSSSSNNKSLDVARSLSLFMKYLQEGDFSIKIRSLQALGSVLIARPHHMLEKDIGMILETTLSSHADCGLKIQALQNMYEYLLDAESQMETDKSSNNVVHVSGDGGHSVPVAAGAGDTNICGGIIQLYWNNVLGRCLDINEQVRQYAIKIVEVVLRQGLVHPITCVPYLIALETDPHEANSKLAHHLLMNMNDKYPTFFEQRLGDGLQLSFIFIQSLTCSEISNTELEPMIFGNTKGKSDGGSSFARLGVTRIYKLIRSNRMSRNKFMSSVIRKFDSPRWNDSAVQFLIYCTELLSLLPFTTPDEPLYLIFAINRIIQVRAGPLELNMKALCLHLLQEHDQKISQENEIIQNCVFQQELNDQKVCQENEIIQNRVCQQDLQSTRLGDSCDMTKDDLQNIQANFLTSVALVLLLKLKRHLKVMYCLNDARCQAYSPSEPLKTGDVLSRQNVPFIITDTNANFPTNHQEFVQKYQEFKQALKEDTIDYSTYTANIKKKRPAVKKVRKSVARANMNDSCDDDDEDYLGGRRVCNSIERKGPMTRGTRQQRV